MTSARNALPIAIAGGGIGGLATALALARHGFRSLVLEQAGEFGEVGVGLQVAPNALSALDALGVGVAAKKHALMIERLLMMDAITGEEVANIPCDERFEKRFGNRYAVAHRAHIHGPLLDACRAHNLIELRTNARVTGFDLENPLVSVLLEAGEQIGAAALIGATASIRVCAKSSSMMAIPYRSRDHFPCHHTGGPDAEGPATPIPNVLGRAGLARDLLPHQRLEHVQPRLHRCHWPKYAHCTRRFRTGDGSAVFHRPLRTSRSRSSHPQTLPPLRHRASGASRQLEPRRSDAAWGRRASDGAVIAQGAAMALEDAICLGAAANECDGDFAQALQHYQEIRIVRTARVQISS